MELGYFTLPAGEKLAGHHSVRVCGDIPELTPGLDVYQCVWEPTETGVAQKGTRQGIRPRRPAMGLPWVLADKSSRAGNKVGPAPCNSPPLGFCIPGLLPVGIASLSCPAGHRTEDEGPEHNQRNQSAETQRQEL